MCRAGASCAVIAFSALAALLQCAPAVHLVAGRYVGEICTTMTVNVGGGSGGGSGGGFGGGGSGGGTTSFPPAPPPTPWVPGVTASCASSGCPMRWVTDGWCDHSCNIAACAFDGGDCVASPPAPPRAPAPPAWPPRPAWPPNYPADCAPGCPSYYLSNNVCDNYCNYPSCNYDGGDCSSGRRLLDSASDRESDDAAGALEEPAASSVHEIQDEIAEHARKQAKEEALKAQAAHAATHLTVGAPRRLQFFGTTSCGEAKYSDERVAFRMVKMTFGPGDDDSQVLDMLFDKPFATCLVGFICSVIAALLLLIASSCACCCPKGKYGAIAGMTGVALVFHFCYYIYLAMSEREVNTGMISLKYEFKHSFSWGVAANIVTMFCIIGTLVSANKNAKAEKNQADTPSQPTVVTGTAVPPTAMEAQSAI